MSNIHLKIFWPLGIEHVYLDLHNTEEGQVLKTFQKVEGEGWCTYDAKVTSFPKTASLEGLHLEYKRSAQASVATQALTYWGVTNIFRDEKTGDLRASWKDVEFRENDVTVPLTITERAVGTMDRVTRPSQPQLRAFLLDEDKCCAISGETQAEALEAAHVVSVESCGTDSPSNALLLRSDLHRLFDADLLYFIVGESKAVAHFSDKLDKESKYSRSELQPLTGKTFNRVAEALRAVQAHREQKTARFCN
jgi:hypothetical protein